MISPRMIVLSVAAASLTACAGARNFDGATRSTTSPLGYVDTALPKAAADNAPLMSISEIKEDTTDNGIGALTDFSDTVWQLTSPEQVPAEPTISARSSINLL